ncbi:MAG: hypothetical protein HYV27_07900 [Candidatus Hydrogenedentes bacterium]|nr:hypothetical protein [Candidatus Hydrogenedentota bacterium]
MRTALLSFVGLTLLGTLATSCTTTRQSHLTHPRPSGFAETLAPGQPANAVFSPVTLDAGFVYDAVFSFPKGSLPPSTVTGVILNGTPVGAYAVRNETIWNAGGHIHGTEDFSIALRSNWTPGAACHLVVNAVDTEGGSVQVEQQASAPATRAVVKGLGFAVPNAAFPYHHATLTLAKEDLAPGTITLVEVDGKRNRDARCFSTGYQLTEKAGANPVPEGENYKGEFDGSRDVQITVPVNWTEASEHTVRVTVAHLNGETKTYEQQATASGKGGYPDPASTGFFSLVLKETEGLLRTQEPIRLALAPFADDIGDPERELRVVTYDPTHPAAAADGYIDAPFQILGVKEWRNKKMLEHEERDAETGERVHRYDPTTTVELVFFADALPYQEKVYLVLYGNGAATPRTSASTMTVTPGTGLSETISTDTWSVLTAANSGALEQITLKGGDGPVLLEHKLETNGAVHWNPGIYSPPTPWVHASDWENPVAKSISGPLMHHTSRYAPLPHMTNVTAHVAYTFYSSQPYILFSSLMEVQEDIFVAALRNIEIVLNHAALNEFIWMDHLGKVNSMPIDGSREHPVHALDIPPDTPWMAFINRKTRVGFANILLDYVNTNRYGDLSSEAQPYIYVQNGPWIYWSRGLVYPFAGNNMTRLMPVRKGSTYYEKNAWLPFRFAEGNNPFAPIEESAARLNRPLLVHEWMPTNDRAPEKWIMPILTMPFDEGVAGAVSAFKKQEEN